MRDRVMMLPYRPPLDWESMIGFLRARAAPGVEFVQRGSYRRTVEVDGAAGAIEVEPVPGESSLRLRLRAVPASAEIVRRARRLFDLDADPTAIDASLGRDAALAPLVAARPGLRVPGGWSGFEIAVRAVLGQQVTVRGATTLCGRLVVAFGRPLGAVAGGGLRHLFPCPEDLASADLASIGIPRARAATLAALARGVAAGAVRLESLSGLDDAVARLSALPGIGPWTAHYVAMRALGESDAFPASDLGIRRALSSGRLVSPAEVEERAEGWRPWRAYAAVHLWSAGADLRGAEPKGS